MRRILGAAVAAVLLVLGPAAAIPAAADTSGATSKPQSVRVASFNIHHGASADDELDLTRTAAVIEHSKADIVGLQEVDNHWSDRSDFQDQASRLGKLLDMHVVFGTNLDLDPASTEKPGPQKHQKPRRQYGTAILSSWPITHWSNTLLPRYHDHEQRGLLYARIITDDGPIRFYTTHLMQHTRPEQMVQAHKVLSLIADPESGSPAEPAVLTGDLNGNPQKPWIKGITHRLIDAWPAAADGPGYTFPADDPVKRIDYVLVSHDVTVDSAAVKQTSASDHLPMIADLTVGRDGGR